MLCFKCLVDSILQHLISLSLCDLMYMFSWFILNYCHYNLFLIIPFIFPKNPSTDLFFISSCVVLFVPFWHHRSCLQSKIQCQFCSVYLCPCVKSLCGRSPDLFLLINTDFRMGSKILTSAPSLPFTKLICSIKLYLEHYRVTTT